MTASAALPTGKRRLALTEQEKAAIILVVPLLFFLTVYWIVPALASLYYSLTNYSVVLRTKWVGLENFGRLVDDVLFWRSLKNSAIFTVGNIPLTMISGLLLAIAVNSGIRFRNLYRVIFYLPMVTSSIALSMVWLWLFDPNFGLLNAGLGVLGVPPQQWLQSTRQALPSIVLMSVWGGVGGTMIIYLAGLQGIPDSIYEAAKVDGAGLLESFRYITLPSLQPVTIYLLVTGVIGSFQIFGPIYAMTNGGPAFATTTIVHQIYINGFRYFNMGYAAAQSWLLFVILLGLSVVNLRLQVYGLVVD
ncbi:MAG: carbohydrate ABC transporter permease [Anaerolineae bacterium]